MASIDYRELQPPAGLRGHVRCFWFLQVSSEHARWSVERVLPDGCLEIVFNLADRFRYLGADGWEMRPRQLVVGPTSQCVVLEPSGEVDLVGIRLQPSGGRSLLRLSMAEIRDRAQPLDEVGTTLPGGLGDRLGSSGSRSDRYRVLSTAIAGSVDRGRTDRRVERACRLIETTAGRQRIDRLAEECDVSTRSLERLFERHVGMSPKLLSRVTRFQRALRSHGRRPSLLDSALAAGYYDQPHFLRDFRDFAGVSPTRFFRKERNRMSCAFTSGGAG